MSRLWTAAGAVVIALLGWSILQSGRSTLLQWSVISGAFAGFGVLWLLAGAGMIVGGLWALGSLGRHRIPLWVSGLASMLAGASIVIGVLASIVPCSGPS